MNRYARQIAVSEFCPEGQARLRGGHVLIVGAGALAAPVLQYLVGAGVGRIVLIDPDRVALSSLHRQTVFRESDVGAPKALAAARHMATLNCECEIEPVIGNLAPNTVASLCARIDVALDCADAFAVSYVLSDHCHAADLPLISASVLGLSGYCGGFCGGAPSLRAVFPDLPERAGSCSADGVLGPVVGVVGAIQAQMALAVLAGMKSSPLGRLVTFDANSWRFGSFSFVGAQEPEHAPALSRQARSARMTSWSIYAPRTRQRWLRPPPAACPSPPSAGWANAGARPACGPVLPLGLAILAGSRAARSGLARRDRAGRVRRTRYRNRYRREDDMTWIALTEELLTTTQQVHVRDCIDTLPRLALHPAALDDDCYERFEAFLSQAGLIEGMRPVSELVVDLEAMP